MPIHEAVTMVMVMAILISGACATIHTVLAHRRKMAKLKYAHGNYDGRLARENVELKETVEMLQDRMAVLERIATDPASRTAHEIEKLR
ncbi:MAG: hypothetical protein AAF941_04180 [Pseudomonadota bacterium]